MRAGWDGRKPLPATHRRRRHALRPPRRGTLHRYVLRQVLIAPTRGAAPLTCAIWLTQSLRFVELIVNRGLTIGTFFYLTMLLLPSFLWLLLPISLFAAVLFTYLRLTTDSELVVM
ncbi:MAG: LptF/LptG family permease, partial [Alphaproteobacteria bacterium]